MTDDEPTPEPSQQTGGSGGFSDGDVLARGPVERPRRNVAGIVVSLIAVLAVIGAAAGYVGYHKLASTGSQPDQWAPANSIAYLKLDFDPSASEKISALRFEQNFPDAPHVTSADQLKDALLNEVFNDPSDSSKIDYATDVKPWLGNRVALAVFPDASGAAQVVGILAVKDPAAAKIGLTKVAQDQQQGTDADLSQAAFAIEGDYAVVGNTQKAVDAAVAAAKASNITSSSNYSNDVAKLKGDRILTGWADLGAVAKLAGNSLLAFSGAQALSGLSDFSDGGGLQGFQSLTGDGSIPPALEIPELASSGAPEAIASASAVPEPSSPAPVASAFSVPDLGVGGLSADGLASSVKGRLVFGLQLQSGSADFEGRIIGSDAGDYQNGNAGSLIGQLPAGSIAGLAASGLGDALTKELATLATSPLAAAGLQMQLNGFGSKLGISLPGDAVNLLGNEFAAGLDSVPAGAGTAKFTLITKPTDQAKGLATAQKIANSIDGGTPGVTVRTAGTDVIISNDAQASGSLADDAGFKAAMSGMPNQVVGALYVNLAGIWSSRQPGTVPGDLTHITGLGGYAAVDGSDIVFDARLTVS
ncbi:MAG TPA: DUF3352 domain-containing protein [Acidothermaceae bacterium]|jgi:hypothetical protein|nr:DUF3352 domain-containing protein [Acidothermaceae bacterium]